MSYLDAAAKLHRGPALSLSYEANSRVGYAGYDCDGVLTDAHVDKFSNVYDALGGKNFTGLFVPTEIDKTCSPFMLSILGEANPLKIARKVVELVPILVIDREARGEAIDKRKPNKTMDGLFSAFPINLNLRLKIPVVANALSNFPFWQHASKRLNLPVSLSAVAHCVRWCANVSKRRNKPLTSFGLNLFPLLHICSPVDDLSQYYSASKVSI